MVPLIVIFRKVRPFATAVTLVLLCLHRLLLLISPLGNGFDTSLLDHLIDGLQRAKDIAMERAESLTFFPTPIMQWLWLVLKDVIAILLVQSLWRLIYRVRNYSTSEWKDLIVEGAFEWAKANFSFVNNFVAEYKEKTHDDFNKALGKDPNRVITRRLPVQGRPTKMILKDMKVVAALEDQKWQKGKVSGAVYPADENHTRLLNEVYATYTWSNPLHAGTWPSVNQYEAEIIAMTANMLHGNDEAVGTTTSGGTESILMAIKAHRDFYGKRRGIETPEIICGSTAHASVDKACDMFKLRKVCIQCDPKTFTLSPVEVEKRITANTILIYASAPSYPQGVIDPIEELSDLAQRYGVGCHVDACLGGFVLPFAKQLGYPIPKFDFECPGVTSMSADTHKYGYGSKGTSVVIYRHQELRRAQYFAYAKWTGGLYCTPTIAGTRSGALLACTWASLVSIGELGYQSRVKSILEASKKIADGITNIPGLHLLGNQAPTMIVCFDSDEMDIYRIGDAMSHKGWELNALQHPACLHVCVTLNIVSAVDKLLDDLRETVAEVRKEGSDGKKRGNAAIYGMAGAFPAGPVKELLRCFTDLALTP